MRIESLYIDGFGHFHDCEVGPFDSPLTVVYGPNEAGKSTLLAFIRTVLFGFPRRHRKEFYPPLNGGQHGGRIQLVSESGARYLVDRTAGANGGKVRIAVSNGDQYEGDETLRKILGHASPTMFETIFAFGLDELTDLNSLSDEEVSGRIYSAGMGANLLPDALKAIDDRRHKLFKNGGSSQAIAKTLNELKQVDEEIERIKKDAAEYQKLVTRREKIGPDLESLTSEVDRLTTELREVKRLKDGWEDWVQLTELEAKLSELPVHESFPDDGLARLNSLEERLQQERQEFVKAEDELDALQEEVNTPIADELLIEDAEEIGPLHKNLGGFESALAELPRLQTDLKNKEEALLEALKELGPNWDEKRLQEFDASLPVRSAIEEWQQNLSKKEQALREAERHYEDAKMDVKYASDVTTEAHDAVLEAERPDFDSAEIDRRRAILRNARNRLDDYRLVKQRREDLEIQAQRTASVLEKEQQQNQRGSNAWAAVGGLGLLSVAIGAILGSQAATFGVIVGLVLFAGAAYLYANRQRPTSEAVKEAVSSIQVHLQEAKQGENRAEKALETVYELLNEKHIDSQKLSELETELDENATKIDRWEKVSTKLESASKEEERRRNRAHDAKEAKQKAEDTLEDTKKEWQAWLEEHGFDDKTLSPTTVTEVFSHVEKTQLKLKSLENTRGQVKDTQADIDDFCSRVVPLAEKHGMVIPDGQLHAVASATDVMSKRLETVRGEVSRKIEAEKAVAKAVRERDSREKRVMDAKDKLFTLLQTVGTDDPENFRRMATEHAEAEKIEQDISFCKVGLQRLGGTGEDFKQFREKLSQTNPEEIADRDRGAQVKLNVATEKKDMLLSEQGRVLSEIERLSAEDEASELRLKRAALIEQLRTDAREWSVLTLAFTILEKARSRYEEERQPGVLKNAQGFFTTVTGKAYKRIVSPLGSNNISVITDNGATKAPEVLSRGTREQLYLALRFGLIQQFAEQETSLPIIVDEVLVNFDPIRAQRAAEAFAKLARTNQVLVFTCHPSMLELFKTTDPEAKEIDIRPFTNGGNGGPPQMP